MDTEFITKQRNEARKLKKSRWWQEKISSDGVSCYYCHQTLTKAQVTMDHIVPVFHGGRSIKSNIVVACEPCNSGKSDKSAVELILEQLKGNSGASQHH